MCAQSKKAGSGLLPLPCERIYDQRAHRGRHHHCSSFSSLPVACEQLERPVDCLSKTSDHVLDVDGKATNSWVAFYHASDAAHER